MAASYHLRRGSYYALFIAVLSCSRRMLFSGTAQILATAGDLLLVTANILVCWITAHFFLGSVPDLSMIPDKWHAAKPILISSAVLVFLDLTVALLNRNPYYAALQPSDPGLRLLSIGSISLLISIFCYLLVFHELTGRRLKNSLIENERLKQAQLRAEINLLQQQLSPHFLFNSLGTLTAIAADQATKNYVHELAKVYRYQLKFNEQLLVELGEELDFLNAYLYILKERFENALIIAIDIPPELLKANLPSLALQILVENAVKHNRASEETPLRIRIFYEGQQGITVENNYQPRKYLPSGRGQGLRNLRDRYRLIAGRDVTISAIESKFSVTVPLL